MLGLCSMRWRFPPVFFSCRVSWNSSVSFPEFPTNTWHLTTCRRAEIQRLTSQRCEWHWQQSRMRGQIVSPSQSIGRSRWWSLAWQALAVLLWKLFWRVFDDTSKALMPASVVSGWWNSTVTGDAMWRGSRDWFLSLFNGDRQGCTKNRSVTGSWKVEHNIHNYSDSSHPQLVSSSTRQPSLPLAKARHDSVGFCACRPRMFHRSVVNVHAFLFELSRLAVGIGTIGWSVDFSLFSDTSSFTPMSFLSTC